LSFDVLPQAAMLETKPTNRQLNIKLRMIDLRLLECSILPNNMIILILVDEEAFLYHKKPETSLRFTPFACFS
jgi:hypothetical protein